jgi:hypothetical protein
MPIILAKLGWWSDSSVALSSNPSTAKTNKPKNKTNNKKRKTQHSVFCM